MEAHIRLADCFAIMVVASALCLAAGAQPSSRTTELTNPIVSGPLQWDSSTPLLLMPAVTASAHSGFHVTLQPKREKLLAGTRASSAASAEFEPLTGPQVAATIRLNFDGVDQSKLLNTGPDALSCDNLTGSAGTVIPPDTNAAVGDTQIVEWVNTCYAIFDKDTGASLAGPFPGTKFWQGFGGVCQAFNDGDPVIQWDKLAHRWVAFQNVFDLSGGSNNYTCIAVSKTADATGSYFRYRYPQALFPDYPKVGIMPKAYYQSQNMFSRSRFSGVAMCAYDRQKLLAGNSAAQQICFLDSSFGQLFDDSMLPADLDSPAHPPASGQPEVFLGSVDNACNGSAVYKYLMYANFTFPNRSKVVGIDGAMPIKVPSFGICNELRNGVPTPSQLYGGSSSLLDSLGDRLMYRLAYSSNGTTQNWVVTHSIDNPSCASGTTLATCGTAVRWYQFTAVEGSTNLTLKQAGQTPDDGESRWMGSAAMDKAGNIAIGYSRTSPNTADWPSIYYAGHAANDSIGVTDREALILSGLGTPDASSGVSRWGDYSSMALDGADGCTFVYANQYQPQTCYSGSTSCSGTWDGTGGWEWRTRIASLKFPGCQ